MFLRDLLIECDNGIKHLQASHIRKIELKLSHLITMCLILSCLLVVVVDGWRGGREGGRDALIILNGMKDTRY